MKIIGRVSLLVLSLTISGSAVLACSSDDATGTTTAGGSTTTTGAGGGGTGTGTGGAGTGGSASGGAGTGGSASGGGGGASSSTTSKDIKAADGGTVTADGATAEIPPDALAADTTITVTVSDAAGEPDAASILSKVYDFGPNGTQFSKPVTLTIDFDPAKLPQGKTAAIAFLDAGKWVPLGDSATNGAKVKATTTHFTKFAIVIAGAPGAGCAGLPFAACGGDPSGTWTWTDACFDVTKNPYEGMCPGSSFVITLDISGTVAFDPAKTFAMDTTSSSTMEIVLPKSCAAVPPDCVGLDDQNPFVDTGDACKQTSVGAPKANQGTGTWSTNGTTLTLVNADQSTIDFPYCVNANELMLQTTASGGLEGTVNYKLTK